MNDMTDSKVLQAAAGLYRNHATGQNKHTASGNVTEDDIRYFNEQADRLESIATKYEQMARAVLWAYDQWLNGRWPQIRNNAASDIISEATGKAAVYWARDGLMEYLGVSDD